MTERSSITPVTASANMGRAAISRMAVMVMDQLYSEVPRASSHTCLYIRMVTKKLIPPMADDNPKACMARIIKSVAVCRASASRVTSGG